MRYRIEKYDGNLIFALDERTQERIKIKEEQRAIDFIRRAEKVSSKEAKKMLMASLENKSTEYTSKPLMLTWQITGKCNCSCLNCGNNSGPSRAEYKREDCDRIIHQIKSMDLLKLTLTGGEPTLSPVFDYLLEQLHFIPRLGVSTNGSNLQKYNVKKLGVDVVKLSLDGLASFHDKYRGIDGLFLKNFKLMENLLDENIEVRVQTTIMKENLMDMVALMKTIDGKANQISFVPLMRTGRSRECSMLLPNEYKTLISNLISESYKLSSKTRVHIRPVFDLSCQDKLENKILNTKYKCEGMKTTMELSYSGNVIPCSFFNHPLGNINDESLMDIWTGKKADSIRGLFETAKNCDTCKECDTYSKCGGGCIANVVSAIKITSMF